MTSPPGDWLDQRHGSIGKRVLLRLHAFFQLLNLASAWPQHSEARIPEVSPVGALDDTVAGPGRLLVGFRRRLRASRRFHLPGNNRLPVQDRIPQQALIAPVQIPMHGIEVERHDMPLTDR
jgi:hypothetical protein